MPDFLMLNIDEIELDISNPRIARLIEMYGNNPSADQINLALGAGSPTNSDSGSTFQSLKESIRSNGSIIHPIIVNKTIDNKLIVIEGNTRVAIYREFFKKRVSGNWNTIPALVYTNLSQAGQDAIRLQAHLVGPRPWDAYSKAKYLNYLRNSEHLPLNQVIDFCGGKRTEVQNYIDAYNDIESYYRPILEDEGDFDATRFTAFVELQKPIIKQSIINAGFTLTDFAKWIDGRLIDPLQTVRDLPKILSTPESKNKFLTEGAKEALKEIIRTEVRPGPDPTTISFDVLVRELIERLRNISFAMIREMSLHPESDRTRNLFNLKDEIIQNCDWIERGND